jgi:glycosyltransferase involved in cell wall biosynthesis
MIGFTKQRKTLDEVERFKNSSRCLRSGVVDSYAAACMGYERIRESKQCIAFIGTAGIPNRYGGFEAFVEQCAVHLARDCDLLVTCDSHLYEDRSADFRGVRRIFVPIRANAAWSVLHDLFAFLRVFRRSSAIVVLGVSGGIWFPFFRLCCAITGKRLVVNIDGVEWRRFKYSAARRAFLKLSDVIAQLFAHRVVYDNPALAPFMCSLSLAKARCIPYSGDHVVRNRGIGMRPRTALTICRIEPENNIELLLEGALASRLSHYVIVGNWNSSIFGRRLRARYGRNSRLELRDPLYDATALGMLRESCAIYLHGHSVGGTNPSLVEMMFYDCDILCFDCPFNRHTARHRATYFADATELAAKIDAAIDSPGRYESTDLLQYTVSRIAAQYRDICAAGAASRDARQLDGHISSGYEEHEASKPHNP